MNSNQKPVFELPKLIALDGKEITEDRLLEELTEDWNFCITGNSCSNGGKPPGLLEDEIA